MSVLIPVHESPDIFRVEVPFPNFATSETNCYLICSEGETLVVDVGAPSARGREIMRAALSEAKALPERTSFFLTHLHMDHAGLVDEVVAFDQKVYLSEIDFQLMRQSHDDEQRAEAIFNRMLSEGAPAYYRGIIDEAQLSDSISASNHTLCFTQPHDTIRVGNYEFEVIDTSGHTPGHQSLFHRESGVFIGGDHVLFVISSGLDLQPDRTDSMAVYLDNLAKVRDMPITELLHSHGPIRPDFVKRINWLIDHHLERAYEAVRIIAEHPFVSGEELTRSLTWNVPHKTWDDISPAQQRYISGEGIVILDFVCGLGDIRRQQGEDGINRYELVRPLKEAEVLKRFEQARKRLEAS